MHFDDNVAVVHFDDDVAVVQFDDDVAVVLFDDNVDRRCPFLRRAFGIDCSILLVKKSVVQKTLDGGKRIVEDTASLFTKGLRFRQTGG